jgi:hypothetical protein
MAVKAVSMEAWRCMSSSDRKDSIGNYVGSNLLDNNKTDTGKKTRWAKTGEISVPLTGVDTFMAHEASMWNESATLPNALSKPAAKKAALDLAKSSPL